MQLAPSNLPPQTRHLLLMIERMVRRNARLQIERAALPVRKPRGVPQAGLRWGAKPYYLLSAFSVAIAPWAIFVPESLRSSASLLSRWLHRAAIGALEDGLRVNGPFDGLRLSAHLHLAGEMYLALAVAGVGPDRLNRARAFHRP